MIWITFGFISGIWFASLCPWGFAVAGMALVFATIFGFKGFRFLLIFFLFFALGSARMELRGVPDSGTNLPNDIQITSIGLVIEEPKPSATGNQLTVEDQSGERILLSTDLYPEYHYGDRIKYSGKLEQPENFLTDSGQEFDYQEYLARQDIYYQIFRPKIEVVARGEGNVISSTLIAVRQKFMEGIESVLPEPQAGLLAGLLIGARSSLDKDVLEDFRTVGLSHMIVLSGYNLTIVAEFVRHIFGFLPLYSNLGLAGVSIILFAAMAGGGAAVWRATLMALLALTARATGRVYEVGRALILTIIALLLWDPRYLVFDLGFQLSILATLGLIFLSPLVEVRLSRIPKRFGLREVVATTLAAQIAVLPWILYQTGQLSPAAFIVNPLVLIVVPVIMFFGFIAGLISFGSVTLAFVPGAVAHLLLSYQLFLANFFARLPFASIVIESFPLIIVVLIYGLYLWWYYRKWKSSGQKPKQAEELNYASGRTSTSG